MKLIEINTVYKGFQVLTKEWNARFCIKYLKKKNHCGDLRKIFLIINIF